jgi:hypothetical protein
MDEFTDIELIAVLLVMAVWGCASVAIDHWIWGVRIDSPPELSSE